MEGYCSNRAYMNVVTGRLTYSELQSWGNSSKSPGAYKEEEIVWLQDMDWRSSFLSDRNADRGQCSFIELSHYLAYTYRQMP